MIERIIKVVNRAGIHARPAALIAETTKGFKSSIHFKMGNNEINAKSVLGVITLGAAYNSEITMIAEGPDEEEALLALEKVFSNKFEEE